EREVADVDHLLDFALALFDDLAGLDGYQPAELRFVLAQLFGEEARQFAAPRWRDFAPSEKGALGASDHAVKVLAAVAADRCDARAVDRRGDRQVASRQQVGGNPEIAE